MERANHWRIFFLLFLSFNETLFPRLPRSAQQIAVGELSLLPVPRRVPG